MSERVVVVDWPQIASRGEVLFPGAIVMYANGSLPLEALETDDCIIVSMDAERLTDFCQQVVSASCRLVRYSTDDISQFTLREEVVQWHQQGGLTEFRGSSIPSPAPQVQKPAKPMSPGAANVAPTEPVGAGLDDDELASGEWGDLPPLQAYESDSQQENALRSIRNAAALKREAFLAEPGEWPEPADFWNATPLPEFSPDVLPPEIAPYVIDQAALRGVDPAFIALYCYTICSALIRVGIDLQMQPDDGADGRVWKEKPILWGAVVGDPSAGKGPAGDIALHKFNKIADDLRQKDEDAWDRYDRQKKIHEKQLQSFYTEAAKNPLAIEPPEPTKPPRERLWTDDVTKEVVAKLLTENPRGKIAIIKDELASWFGGFDAYGNGKSDKDRPDWLSFYESKQRYVDRAMEGRSYHVKSWGGIILGGIQPETLSKISGKLGADGMLQRFQIILAGPKKKDQKRPADIAAVKRWHRVQENLANLVPGPNSMRLSPEAEAYMDAQQDWIDRSMTAGLMPPLVAALGKWPGLFGRLMCVSACIRAADAGMTTPPAVISLDIAEQAWRWLKELIWPHALQFYMGQADLGDETKSIRQFAEFILARELNGKIRPHWINSNWSHYRYTLKNSRARREFWIMAEQAGWVRAVGTFDRNGGQLASEYEVNPLAFDGRFSDQIKQARNLLQRNRDAMPEWMGRKREPGEE